MNSDQLKALLEGVKNGTVDIDHAFKEIKALPYEDLGFAKIDHHRSIRVGYPEVVYCEGKTSSQIVEIIKRLMEKNNNILATRASKEDFAEVSKVIPDAEYHEIARIIVVRRKEIIVTEKQIAVITAGTSDIPVAEEAAITAEVLGNRVNRIYDVGVAGIHRLLSKMDTISQANVIIVVAGMEGALASVVGGLVDKPVIAVPTSVGYGANFGGLSALLTMLNSCASGIGVVNIDNGFGAGYLASNINKL